MKDIIDSHLFTPESLKYCLWSVDGANSHLNGLIHLRLNENFSRLVICVLQISCPLSPGLLHCHGWHLHTVSRGELSGRPSVARQHREWPQLGVKGISAITHVKQGQGLSVHMWWARKHRPHIYRWQNMHPGCADSLLVCASLALQRRINSFQTGLLSITQLR